MPRIIIKPGGTNSQLRDIHLRLTKPADNRNKRMRVRVNELNAEYLRQRDHLAEVVKVVLQHFQNPRNH